MATNYKNVEKMNVDDLIKEVLGMDHILSVPIEHYSKEEIMEIAERAKKTKLLFTIQAEYSNFYQGILLNLIKRENVNENFIKHI